VNRGQVKRKKEAISIFTADEDMTKTIEAWISMKRYSKLMELWVKSGYEWDKLYDEVKNRAVSACRLILLYGTVLVPKVKDQRTKLLEEASNEVIHPLYIKIHPTLQYKGILRLSQQEFFLKTIWLRTGTCCLGMAYLEMVLKP
jgi:polyketide synthase PksN